MYFDLSYRCGNYSKEETIRGYTVISLKHGNSKNSWFHCTLFYVGEKFALLGRLHSVEFFYVQNVSCFMQKLQSLSARVLWTFLWIHSFFNAFFSNRFQSRNPICLQMSKPSGLRYRILEFGIWNLELPETCSSKLSTCLETGM